ncbi:MAG: CHASE2 domain-containing protein [Chthoniobacterales bacterium]
MRRPSPWLMLVVLLAGILVLREPRFEQADDLFLRWLLEHSPAREGKPVPLTVVEISRDSFGDPNGGSERGGRQTSGDAVSPLEFALFLQSVLDFQPNVIAFENILKWRQRDKDQEQIFLDQAMRVPRLLLAAELSTTSDPDAPWGDIRGFPQVTGKRGDLATFTGVGREPDEDLRLISTQGFVNLPEEESSSVRVPLLFMYRGEVIPSFTLQAILLWLRVTPAEVKIDLGSQILLPQNRRIPIATDGTLLVNPNAGKSARRIGLNDMLLAAQQRDTGNAAAQQFADLRDQIILARTPQNPLSPPDIFASTIATIQSNEYLHRISHLFDCVMLLLITACVPWFHRFERVDLVLCGIAVTAAYCLLALATLTKWNLWLPGTLPLGALWLAIFITFFFRQKDDAPREIAIPPPIA